MEKSTAGGGKGGSNDVSGKGTKAEYYRMLQHRAELVTEVQQAVDKLCLGESIPANHYFQPLHLYLTYLHSLTPFSQLPPLSPLLDKSDVHYLHYVY